MIINVENILFDLVTKVSQVVKDRRFHRFYRLWLRTMMRFLFRLLQLKLRLAARSNL